jgi:hypothetical protein
MPLMALAAIGCSDANGPSSRTGSSRLVFSVTAGTPAGAPQAAPETIGVGNDVLVLNQVDLVLRQIELDRVGAIAACDTTGDGIDGSSEDGASEHHDGNDDAGDDCAEVQVGPMLVSLPLGGGSAHEIDVPLAPGTYDKVQFQIHKPDDDTAGDAAFLAANPDFRRVSIRVRGTFNGTAFEYLSAVSAQQQVVLSPPLVLAADSTARLNLTVDVRGWFLDAGQNRLVNPTTALKGQPNEGLVTRNIKSSLRAKGYYGRDG